MIKSGGPAVKNLARQFRPAPKRRRKKEGGVKWGFRLGTSSSAGSSTFLAFGGIDAAIFMSTGRISIYLAIGAAGGLLYRC